MFCSGRRSRINKELKECTFKPKVNHSRSKERDHSNISKNSSKKSTHRRRNVDEFLKDQSEFQQRKMQRLEELSKERDKNESKTFRPKIDKKSKIMFQNDKENLHSIPVHKRLHDLSKRRCRNKVKSTLETDRSQNRSQDKSHNVSRTRRNYITEQINITELLAQKSRRCKSKDIKPQSDVHTTLYDDAFRRKIIQNKIENGESKNQSIRSFIKHRKGSHNFMVPSKSARILKKHSEDHTANVSKRLSKGFHKKCRQNKRIHKCGSTNYINSKVKPSK